MFAFRMLRIVSVSSSLWLVACGGGGGSPEPGDPGPNPQGTPVEQLTLKAFAADCSDFLDYTADALTEQFLTSFYCTGFGPCPVFSASPVPTPAPTPAPGAGADNEGFSGPDRVSGTNVQEAGVDEADIVKADADGRLYILSGRSLHILAAFPPQGLEQRPLASLDLAGGDDTFYASDIFLDESAELVIALGGSYGGERPQAIATIVDVSDPSVPAILRRVAIDGGPLLARRIDDRVHRVSRYDIPLPSWFYGADDELSALRSAYNDARANGEEDTATQIKAQIRDEIGARVDAAGAASFLPRSRVSDADGASETTLACDAIAHPEVTTGLGLALVDSFDGDGSAHAVGGVVNNGYVVYASATNLYIAQSSFGWFFEPDQIEESVIYRLALSATGPAAYRGLAKVDGTIANSYQLSEYEGSLRVAATEQRVVGDAFEPVTHVSVFNTQVADVMPLTGALRDLAPGETLQGSRFVGDRGFVVTFRQVDPLFAIDLSNPAQPRLASELKIPGFSSYLMPLGDDYLLTIGRAGTDEQLTGRVAVQLFDVSDLDDVRQLAVLEPQAGSSQYSYSIAEYDPHAFSYFADATDAAVPGTLSVPLQSYGNGAGDSFSGFLVVRVDPQGAVGLAELGRVDHSSLVDSEPFCGPGGDTGAPCFDAVYAAEPRRSVFMEDASGRYLYTVSLAGLIASDAAAPATLYGSRTLPYDPPCCFFAEPGGGAR